MPLDPDLGPPCDEVPDVQSPEGWRRVVDAASPATLLLIIESRLGVVSKECGAEDVLQETLMRAWQARGTLQWMGYRAFRSWLLTIADRCIADARERHFSQKRGGGRSVSLSDGLLPDTMGLDPAGSTTPSRVARVREESQLIRSAISDLPDDVREVVRLRLLEQLTMQDVAARLGLSLATVQHRVRRGAALYQTRLRALFATSSIAAPVARSDAVSEE
jgi:RNA polymerase sigma-70 factor (ECF subfamily)